MVPPQMSKLDEKSYEKLLKEDLVCWKCESPMKNIPTLKDHLQEEWDKTSKREKAKAGRKRKFEEEGLRGEHQVKPDVGEICEI